MIAARKILPLLLPLLLAAQTLAGPPATSAALPVFAVPKGYDELLAMQKQVEDVVPQALASTVAVFGPGGQGSGVIVTKDGYVLTAGHVSREPGQRVRLVCSDGLILRGKTLGALSNVDGGLIKITNEGEYPFSPMGKSDPLKNGQWVLALGFGGGFSRDHPALVRLGRVIFRNPRLVASDATLIGGDSGGPLFDLTGHVVGINSRIGATPLANVHAPIDAFTTNWAHLLENKIWSGPATTIPAYPDGPTILDDTTGFSFSTDSTRSCDALKDAFKNILSTARQSTVVLRCNSKDVALGTIVDSDGYILTKASELSGRIVCRLSDNTSLPAKVIGVVDACDLAMLKVDRTKLPAIAWAEKTPHTVGAWVATPGSGERPVAVGIISISQRKIPHQSGVLGITLAEAPQGVKVNAVMPDSPAQAAGVQADDIILQVGDHTITTPWALSMAIHSYAAGAEVALTLQRGGKVVQATARLAGGFVPPVGEVNVPQLVSGAVSRRSSDFPSVIQHDTILRPMDCGGPLVLLSGQAVGINIARASRTDSYALPADVILPLLADLKAGKYPTTLPAPPPPPVHLPKDK